MQLRFRSVISTVAAVVSLAVMWAVASTRFAELFTRPLNTLSNVVAALRSDDYSVRARGAQRGDAMGDLALEINLLATTLQGQRTATLDALTLVEQVLSSMQSPVLAFDSLGRLRLKNDAACKAFSLSASDLGAAAHTLKLRGLLELSDQEVLEAAPQGTRWSIRRTNFRLYGVPHTLFVLTDVAAALREEERLAWQRIIRVLSHEINNSLAPIQSIAGSLRTRVARLKAEKQDSQALERGLTVIEDRSASLHRFLQNYQQLSQLPKPVLRRISVCDLLERILPLETRLNVVLEKGPDLYLVADQDLLEHALINLLHNAADAALEQTARLPDVRVSWSAAGDLLTIEIRDNGLGLANTSNLFVPFYTTKPSGSGIGLVLAQQIANIHGGSVTLSSRYDGPGCVAAMNLPRATPRGDGR